MNEKKGEDEHVFADKKVGIYALSASCLLVGLILFVAAQKPVKDLPIPRDEPDLLRHPVYSAYRFKSGADVIRIGIQPFWVFGANIIEAMRRDNLLRQVLADLGMRVAFYSFFKGPDINFFANRDLLEGGMLGYLPTLSLAYSKEITIPAIIDQGFNEIVAQGCLTISDLKGKRIGVPMGSDAHHMLTEALDAAKIDADQVTLVPMDVADMAAAMEKGLITASAAWPPASTNMLTRNPEARLIHRSLWLSFFSFERIL